MDNKKKYILFKDKISKIVNTVDPLGLIEGGAPLDEYLMEIEKITSFVLNNKNINISVLTSEVCNILLNSFGSDANISNEKCYKISQLILMIK